MKKLLIALPFLAGSIFAADSWESGSEWASKLAAEYDKGVWNEEISRKIEGTKDYFPFSSETIEEYSKIAKSRDPSLDDALNHLIEADNAYKAELKSLLEKYPADKESYVGKLIASYCEVPTEEQKENLKLFQELEIFGLKLGDMEKEIYAVIYECLQNNYFLKADFSKLSFEEREKLVFIHKLDMFRRILEIAQKGEESVRKTILKAYEGFLYNTAKGHEGVYFTELGKGIKTPQSLMETEAAKIASDLIQKRSAIAKSFLPDNLKK